MADLRVLIVDGHEKVRCQLAATLGREPELEIVGTAGTGQEAMQQMRSFRPDLVLLDVKMDGGEGVETCRRIAAMAPLARIAVLTSYPDEAERTRVLSAGACAYMVKEIGTKQLVHAILGLGTAGVAGREGRGDRT